MQWGSSCGLKDESLVKRVEGNEGALVRNGGKDLGSREVAVAMTYGCRVPSFFLVLLLGLTGGHIKVAI